MTLPTLQTSVHGHPGPSMSVRPAPQRHTTALRPDPGVSSFEVNHDAILSTIPSSRGPSRRPSPSQSPHMSRVQSRSRIPSLLSEVAAVGPSTTRRTSGRATPSSRSREMLGQQDEENEAMFRALTARDAEEQLRYEIYGDPSSSSRSLPPLLPLGLMEQVMLTPDTPADSSSERLNARGRHESRRSRQGDVSMTE